MGSTSSPAPTIRQTDLPGLSRRGKVRDIYQLDDHLLLVATDRVSAFDVVMNEPVPGKGVILTMLSKFWLDALPACKPHHLEYIVDERRVPAGYEAHRAALSGRAMYVRRVEIAPVECVVRGYLSGTGWKSYVASGEVCGHKLPAGLVRNGRLPEPLFTPTTKAKVGHDEPLTFEEVVATLDAFVAGGKLTHLTGRQLAEALRARSLEIYRQASAHAESRGIILADTKFEFGLRDGELILADEVLTPDCARFWATEKYRPGEDQESFDKQVLRDYLESCQGWNKQYPPPRVPGEVISRMVAAYQDAYRRLTDGAAHKI